jgi:outer membrane protein assembly factor BamB
MRRRDFLRGVATTAAIGTAGCTFHGLTGGSRSASVAWTWSAAAVDDFVATPERAYVATDSTVVALSVADGSVVWETALAAQSVHAADGVVVCYADDGGETVGLDAATGDRRWTRRGDLFSWPSHDTAVLDGDRLRAVDLRSGEVRWTVTSADDWQATAADAERVYAVAERDNGPSMHAFDRTAGRERWQTELAPGFLWSAALLDDRLVLGTDRTDPDAGRVAGFDPATGDRLWGIDLGPTLPAPAPAATVDGHVAVDQFVTDGRGDTCLLDAGTGRQAGCRADQRFLAADDERVVSNTNPGSSPDSGPTGPGSGRAGWKSSSATARSTARW